MSRKPVERDEALRLWEGLAPALALSVLLALLVEWLAQDHAPPLEHSGRSIRDAVQLWQGLIEGRGILPDPYPPLAYLVSGAVWQVWGLSWGTALLSQGLFLVPYLGGCWWAGRELGGRAGGAFSVLAAAGSPLWAYHLHGYFLEVGTTALVAAGFALLLASRGCRRRGPTLALGAVLGLGMLSKWSFALFMAPGLLWPCLDGWREGPRSRRWLVAAGLWLFGIAGLVRALPSGLGPIAGLAVSLGWLGIGLGAALDRAQAQAQAPNVPGRGRSGASRTRPGPLGRPPLEPPLEPPVEPPLGGQLAAGNGAVLALSVGGGLCSWWYGLALDELRRKALQDAGQAYPLREAVETLVNTVHSAWWLTPLWLALATLAALRIPALRRPTLIAWAGILGPLFFYLVYRVPTSPRYLLPSLVFIHVLSFAWWGRIRWLSGPGLPLLGAALALVGWVQVAAWTGDNPLQPWTQALMRREATPWRLTTVPPPEPRAVELGPTVARIMQELERTGEHRLTTMLLPGSKVDVDALIFEALLRGRQIDIVVFPVREGGEDFNLFTSLFLVAAPSGDPLAQLCSMQGCAQGYCPPLVGLLSPTFQLCSMQGCAQGYRRLGCWEDPRWGRWCLARDPTRRDPRPPPRLGTPADPPPVAPPPPQPPPPPL